MKKFANSFIMKKIKNTNDIPMDQWKLCYAAYFSADGSSVRAYEMLSKSDEFDKNITRKMFTELVDVGIKAKSLPSLQQLFITNMRKAMATQGTKIRESIDRTVEIADMYLGAIQNKVADMTMNPETMSKNIGTELDKTFSIFMKYNDLIKGNDSDRVDITPDQALMIKKEAAGALSRITDDDDDYGLDKRLKA